VASLSGREWRVPVSGRGVASGDSEWRRRVASLATDAGEWRVERRLRSDDSEWRVERRVASGEWPCAGRVARG
jgi:hypothetical protein